MSACRRLIYGIVMSHSIWEMCVIIDSVNPPGDEAKIFWENWSVTWLLMPWAPSQYKDHLSRYGDFHYKDETVIRPSHLYNGNSHIGKTTSLYWYKTLAPCITRSSATMVLTIYKINRALSSSMKVFSHLQILNSVKICHNGHYGI